MLKVVPQPTSGQSFASPSSSASQEPPVETDGPSEVSSPLAIRADGAVLLSIEELGARDLTGYTLWTAVVLHPEQSAFARSRITNTAVETAALLQKTFPKKRLDS